MSDGFSSHFRLVPDGQIAGHVWFDDRLISAIGYLEFAGKFAGCTFENGLYRFHDDLSGPRGAALIQEAFPKFASRACPFAFDWLGRQFALDSERIEGGQALILMMEPGTGEALEIPWPFARFHEQLQDLREPALAASFFSEWAGSNPNLVPLKVADCVGYRIPLFLGGKDNVENLEVVDLAVYWSLCGQLRQGTRQLPPGTSIRQISIS